MNISKIKCGDGRDNSELYFIGNLHFEMGFFCFKNWGRQG